MLVDRTIPAFLDAIGSADPTPGGGSAAALVAATGTALLAMVAGMPKTRTNTPEARAALDHAQVDLMQVRQTLIALIDRDAAAYDLVVAAFRRPKGTDEEKAVRKAAVQDAMRVATEVPLETIQACVDAMRAGQPVQTHGNPAAASDATVGYRLLLAAAQSAQDNVEINLDGLAGTDLRARLRAAAAQLVREALEMHAAAVLT